MTQLKRRATYRYGTLVPEPPRRGPDVWVYQFFENRNGKRVRRKAAVGTLDKLPKRADAEPELVEWISAECKCCPFFGLEIEFQRNSGPLWLKLKGHKGVKAFIKSEFNM